jgi:hypothetical protein
MLCSCLPHAPQKTSAWCRWWPLDQNQLRACVPLHKPTPAQHTVLSINPAHPPPPPFLHPQPKHRPVSLTVCDATEMPRMHAGQLLASPPKPHATGAHIALPCDQQHCCSCLGHMASYPGRTAGVQRRRTAAAPVLCCTRRMIDSVQRPVCHTPAVQQQQQQQQG